jgi:branched-chain amino acid transport system permease protein
MNMLAQFLQYLFSGLTVGATYALAALGFTLIYNASSVINFAQGEFIMLGGMLAVYFTVQSGLPLPAALVLAILIPAVRGLARWRSLRSSRSRGAETVTLIIVTIGASLVIRGAITGLARQGFARPASVLRRRAAGDLRRHAASAKHLGTRRLGHLVVVGLWYFFNRTLSGKAMLATSCNRIAAELVGINTSSRAFRQLRDLGGTGRARRNTAHADHLDLIRCRHHAGPQRASSRPSLGGLGSGLGAVVGGLLVGVIEAMGQVMCRRPTRTPFLSC